jgi:hypothetical protein
MKHTPCITNLKVYFRILNITQQFFLDCVAHPVCYESKILFAKLLQQFRIPDPRLSLFLSSDAMHLGL